MAAAPGAAAGLPPIPPPAPLSLPAQPGSSSGAPSPSSAAAGGGGDGRFDKCGFAKLLGPDFEYYVKTYEVTLGRRSKAPVDVPLGDSPVLSRQHARIAYSFGRRRWELLVEGKNGVVVNGATITPQSGPQPLNSQDFLQAGDTHWYFLLPKPPRKRPGETRGAAVGSAGRSKGGTPVPGGEGSPALQLQQQPLQLQQPGSLQQQQQQLAAAWQAQQAAAQRQWQAAQAAAAAQQQQQQGHGQGGALGPTSPALLGASPAGVVGSQAGGGPGSYSSAGYAAGHQPSFSGGGNGLPAGLAEDDDVMAEQ